MYKIKTSIWFFFLSSFLFTCSVKPDIKNEFAMNIMSQISRNKRHMESKAEEFRVYLCWSNAKLDKETMGIYEKYISVKEQQDKIIDEIEFVIIAQQEIEDRLTKSEVESYDNGTCELKKQITNKSLEDLGAAIGDFSRSVDNKIVLLKTSTTTTTTTEPPIPRLDRLPQGFRIDTPGINTAVKEAGKTILPLAVLGIVAKTSMEIWKESENAQQKGKQEYFKLFENFRIKEWDGFLCEKP